MTSSQVKAALYVLFILSGFSGLVYESIWSRYLKLFLGHAAYAQALVLVIFMGGMALGAWAVSRYVRRIPNLLAAYAAVEAAIGLFGIGFHSLYGSLSLASFEYVIPALGAPFAVNLYKLAVASLIILPQSVLLGATFPLMSGGFIRRFPGAPGQSISLLYCVNSLGAAAALLFSSFYLVKAVGLPGTMQAAGVLNIVVAVLVYALAGRSPGPYPRPAERSLRRPGPAVWLLAAAFFTGMASFIYEVAWIRMLSMVLGASTHAFELMLSAFITGLALGGWWIRSRIDRLEDPAGFAGRVQILMGAFALATIFLYGYSYELMGFFMAALNRTGEGYHLFSLASHGIALLVMLPATICAGMTLPLFTFILLNDGHGERSIGQIYACNTAGAIAGVLFTIFVALPIWSLKGALISGALIDIGIGLALIGISVPAFRSRRPAYLAMLAVSLALAAALFQIDHRRMASGVFRHGMVELEQDTRVIFHEDGRTASVTVTNWDDKKISILTNGKPDASIAVGEGLPPAIDESTMTLLAALPLAVHPAAGRLANIGIGSGLTSHVALGWPEVERVDTIEIEPAMVEGARRFGEKTAKVYTDPRSRIRIEDARTWLSTAGVSYDLIISEPSNPWVSGVANLFTREFYGIVRHHLNPRGMLVQWLHLYEFNLDLLVSVLKAISLEFPHYALYFADDGDLILLARADGPVGIPDPAVFAPAAMKAHLAGVYIHNIEDLRFRFIGDQYLFGPFLRDYEVPANSDYYPYLDLNAEKARFLGERVSKILDLRLTAVPVLDLLYPDRGLRTENLSRTEAYPFGAARTAHRVYEYFSGKVFDKDNIDTIASLNFLSAAGRTCAEEYNHEVWVDSVFLVLGRTIAYLTTAQVGELLDAVTPACGVAALPDNLADWLRFFRAINENDTAGVINASGGILRADANLDLEQRRFLMTALLTGLVKSGEYGQAQGLWQNHMAALFDAEGEVPLVVRLLLAMAAS